MNKQELARVIRSLHPDAIAALCGSERWADQMVYVAEWLDWLGGHAEKRRWPDWTHCHDEFVRHLAATCPGVPE